MMGGHRQPVAEPGAGARAFAAAAKGVCATASHPSQETTARLSEIKVENMTSRNNSDG
jgi:hypothetical protein